MQKKIYTFFPWIRKTSPWYYFIFCFTPIEEFSNKKFHDSMQVLIPDCNIKIWKVFYIPYFSHSETLLFHSHPPFIHSYNTQLYLAIESTKMKEWREKNSRYILAIFLFPSILCSQLIFLHLSFITAQRETKDISHYMDNFVCVCKCKVELITEKSLFLFSLLCDENKHSLYLFYVHVYMWTKYFLGWRSL